MANGKPLTKTQLVLELVDRVADTSGENQINKKSMSQTLDALAEIVQEQVRDCEACTLPGIGKMTMVDTKAREGRNPATGEKIQIPAGKRVKFVVAKSLKNNVLGN